MRKKLRKWLPKRSPGGPKIFQNPPKSSKVPTKVPSGVVLGAVYGETGKKHDLGISCNPEKLNIAQEGCSKLLFPSMCKKGPRISPKWFLLGTLWPRWAPKCAQMSIWGRSGESLKFCVFLLPAWDEIDPKKPPKME